MTFSALKWDILAHKYQHWLLDKSNLRNRLKTTLKIFRACLMSKDGIASEMILRKS